jgi:hypothetical protein
MPEGIAYYNDELFNSLLVPAGAMTAEPTSG